MLETQQDFNFHGCTDFSADLLCVAKKRKEKRIVGAAGHLP